MKSTLLELLKAELVGEHPPVGWYTVVELMEKLSVKRGIVEGLVTRKKYECKRFRTQTKDGKMILGSPARAMRDLTPEQVSEIKTSAEIYVANARRYASGLTRATF